MKSGLSAKALLVGFAVIVIFYLASFYGIEHWRHRKGAWEVNFISDAEGNPAIVAYQTELGISSVELVFLGEHLLQTNLSTKVIFDRPLKSIPFGKVIYEDLTTLPGVVTFDFFGHEVELLPRVLIVNKQQIPWKSDSTIELATTNKPAEPPKPPKGSRRN